jgi:hypothetical protein
LVVALLAVIDLVNGGCERRRRPEAISGQDEGKLPVAEVLHWRDNPDLTEIKEMIPQATDLSRSMFFVDGIWERCVTQVL